MARWGLLFVLLVGCGSEPPARSAPVVRPAASTAPILLAPTKCPALFDVADLFARHARAFGSADALKKSLPVTLLGEAEVEGKKGRAQLVLGPSGYRGTTALPSFFNAWGRDTIGLWGIRGSVGVVERTPREHEKTEATESLLDEWIWRRTYTSATSAASAKCIDEGTPRVDVSFKLPELGEPVLVFDLASAALVSITRRDPIGTKLTTTIEAWTDPDKNGVRFPKRMTDHPPVGSTTTVTYAKVTSGWACERLEPNGPSSLPINEGCLVPPPDRFVLRWPANVPVRVPFTLSKGQLLVRAKINGRDVWAIFDSGAGVTVVDATTPSGQAFKPAIEMEGAGATQKIRLGFGEIATLSLGDLRADTVPAASVPVPALDAFGAKRPELILGYSFFAATVTRIDYKKREIVFGQKLDGLVAKDARSHDMRVIDGKLFAKAIIEGHEANMMIDTGSSGGLDITKKWATAHGLPGDRKTIEVKGLFGAGTTETPATFFRTRATSLGPIKIEGALTSVEDGPVSDFAGMAGNDAFARCDAIIFDREGRKLWFEGTCDRAIPERKMGWRLARSSDPKSDATPWVVAMLIPSGSADAAGIRVGDRVLEVAGKPLGADVEGLEKIEQQPEGTKVPVVVLRDGKKERLVVELHLVLK